jgi:hypothetical protein
MLINQQIKANQPIYSQLSILNGQLDNFITLLILIICLIGLWLIFGPSIRGLFQSMVTNNQFERTQRKAKQQQTASKLQWLVEATSQLPLPTFIGLSVALGGLTLLLFIFLGDVTTLSMIISLLVTALPFLFTWYRLERLRLKGSYDGDELVNVLINEYIHCHYDMVESIDQAVVHFDQSMTYTRTCLARLGNELKLQQTDSELDDSIDRFVFSYNTEWAIILGFCIKTAIRDRTVVLDALQDLLENFKRATQAIEKGKRYRRETIVILNILSPLTYVGLMFVSVDMFGNRIASLVQQQLTGQGFQLFMLIMSLYLIGLLVGSIISKPKFDL